MNGQIKEATERVRAAEVSAKHYEAAAVEAKQRAQAAKAELDKANELAERTLRKAVSAEQEAGVARHELENATRALDKVRAKVRADAEREAEQQRVARVQVEASSAKQEKLKELGVRSE